MARSLRAVASSSQASPVVTSSDATTAAHRAHAVDPADRGSPGRADGRSSSTGPDSLDSSPIGAPDLDRPKEVTTDSATGGSARRGPATTQVAPGGGRIASSDGW